MSDWPFRASAESPDSFLEADRGRLSGSREKCLFPTSGRVPEKGFRSRPGEIPPEAEKRSFTLPIIGTSPDRHQFEKFFLGIRNPKTGREGPFPLFSPSSHHSCMSEVPDPPLAKERPRPDPAPEHSGGSGGTLPRPSGSSFPSDRTGHPPLPTKIPILPMTNKSEPELLICSILLGILPE